MAKPAYIYDGTQWVPVGPSLGPNSPISYQTSAPSSPYTGQVWTDSDEGQKILRVWTGSAWALYDGYSTATPSVTTYASGAYTLALADRDGIVNLTGGTNLVTNPSFETDLSGWSGAQSLSRSTEFSLYGAASLSITMSSTTDNNIAVVFPTVTVGMHCLSAYFYIPAGSALAGRTVVWQVEGGTATTTTPVSSPGTLVAGSWVRASLTRNVTAAGTMVSVARISGSLASAVGLLVYTDGALVEMSSNLNPYFDNSYACVVTVPTNATAAFPVGTRTQLVNTSSGTVSVVGASGVTMTGVQTIASHQMMTLIKLGTDSWERISAVSSETGIHSFTSMGA